MLVLIVGSGRTGAAIAKRMLKEGYEVSVLDESPESHALLDHGLDQSWEDSGGGFTVGTALEVDALLEAGIERADVVVCSTDGDNTNIVVAQIAKKRFQIPKVVVRVHDPYRAEWYRQQGLQTVSPTQVAIEMLTDAVLDGGGSGAGDVIKESR
ncbi:MAG: NAD-binding protein [Solirubrobacterales bacterium]